MKSKKNIILILIIIFAFNVYANNENYKIQVGDVLKIYVWKHPKFDRTVKVNINGDIIYDVIGRNIRVKNLPISKNYILNYCFFSMGCAEKCVNNIPHLHNLDQNHAMKSSLRRCRTSCYARY